MKLEPVIGDDPATSCAVCAARCTAPDPRSDSAWSSDFPAEVRAGTAVVVTTSGSTGVPKSVILSRDALTASALATADRIGDGAWLLALPASYVAGLQVLVRSIVADREPAWLTGAFTPQAFSAAALMMVSTDHGERVPTFTSLVPAQLTKLLDAAAHDPIVLAALRSFETILVGGQAIAPATLERAQDAGVRVVRTYGSTETSGGCVYDGRPLRGVSVRIVDGEVQVAGPTLADGYLGDSAATDAAFPRDADGTRWYRTARRRDHRGRPAARARQDRQRHRLRRDQRLARSRRAGRPRRSPASSPPSWSASPTSGGARHPSSSSRAAKRCGAASRCSSRRRARPSPTRSAPHARPTRLVLVDDFATLPSGKPDREAIRAAVAALH